MDKTLIEADYDLCDEHETTFPRGGSCPECASVLPDYVREMVESLNKTVCLTHGKKAADMLERVWREKGALEYAVQSYAKSIGELQQRNAEIGGERDRYMLLYESLQARNEELKDELERERSYRREASEYIDTLQQRIDEMGIALRKNHEYKQRLRDRNLHYNDFLKSIHDQIEKARRAIGDM